jgi:hypothetical protein
MTDGVIRPGWPQIGVKIAPEAVWAWATGDRTAPEGGAGHSIMFTPWITADTLS